MRLLPYAVTIALGAATMAFSAPSASAQQLTNTMTCAQAQQTYAARGSIRTRTRMGSVVVLSGGVPATQRRKLTCMRSTRMPIMAETTDNRRCPISYRCR